MRKGLGHQDQAIIMCGLMEIGTIIVNQGHTIVVMVFGQCPTVDEDINPEIGETTAVVIIGLPGVGDN